LRVRLHRKQVQIIWTNLEIETIGRRSDLGERLDAVGKKAVVNDQAKVVFMIIFVLLQVNRKRKVEFAGKSPGGVQRPPTCGFHFWVGEFD
jgi:hypothetical protein